MEASLHLKAEDNVSCMSSFTSSKACMFLGLPGTCFHSNDAATSNPPHTRNCPPAVRAKKKEMSA
eukprot:scaffold92743_cov18-Tisochrysis_lutea.AAC.1